MGRRDLNTHRSRAARDPHPGLEGVWGCGDGVGWGHGMEPGVVLAPQRELGQLWVLGWLLGTSIQWHSAACLLCGGDVAVLCTRAVHPL